MCHTPDAREVAEQSNIGPPAAAVAVPSNARTAPPTAPSASLPPFHHPNGVIYTAPSAPRRHRPSTSHTAPPPPPTPSPSPPPPPSASPPPAPSASLPLPPPKRRHLHRPLGPPSPPSLYRPNGATAPSVRVATARRPCTAISVTADGRAGPNTAALRLALDRSPRRPRPRPTPRPRLYLAASWDVHGWTGLPAGT